MREGKITHVGISNFAAWQIAVGQGLADRRGLLELVSEQSLYNLTARTVELEVVPALRYLSMGLLPWSAGTRAAGRRARKAVHGRSADPARQEEIEQLRDRLQAHEQLCGELGHAPAQVALAWSLHQPVVPSVVTGPRTVEQLMHNLRALRVCLGDEALERLDQLWPGPGGGLRGVRLVAPANTPARRAPRALRRDGRGGPGRRGGEAP